MNAVIERVTSPAFSTDTWVNGTNGRFWGSCGAAGLLIENDHSEILMQYRASWCDQGNTWGIPGGARLSHETPIEAAFRETREEHGLPDTGLTILDSHSLDYGYWSYVTVVAKLRGHWEPGIKTSEAEQVLWVPIDTVHTLQLHSGFRSSWRQLQAILARHR